MKRKCVICGALLSQDNSDLLCSPCKKERIRSETESLYDLCYDAEQLADILGFDETESVLRLARKGKLPPHIPNIKKYMLKAATIMGQVYLTYSSTSQYVIPAKKPSPHMKLKRMLFLRLVPVIASRNGIKENQAKNASSLKLKNNKPADNTVRIIRS